MGTGAEAAAVALEMMNDWDWDRYDYRGDPLPPGKDLSLVISRLAMEGLSSPPEVVLGLLCQGDLVARADYQWRKYEGGHHYFLEGSDEVIKPPRWQVLEHAIDDELRNIFEASWTGPTVKLERLGLKECSIYEWEFADNHFCTAICPLTPQPLRVGIWKNGFLPRT